VCVLNEAAAQELVGYTDCLDEHISLNGMKLRVVGILEDDEESLTSVFGSDTSVAYVPYSTLVRMSTTVSSDLEEFYVSAAEGHTVDEAEANSDGFTTTAIGATGRVTAMGSTAVFTNTKNDYNRRNTNVSLRARKNLTGRALKSGEFSFTLKEGSRTLQTKTNDASGNVSFDTIEYTSPGTYTYTIEEVRGNDATVTYDTHAARVTVRVTEDSNGNLSASATYDSSSGATFNNTAGKVPPTPTPTPGTPAATPATQATVTPATVTPSTVLTSLPSRLAVTADPTAVLPVLALAAVGSAAAIGGLARRRRRK
jgi:pilin isopeptide linkage protein